MYKITKREFNKDVNFRSIQIHVNKNILIFERIFAIIFHLKLFVHKLTSQTPSVIIAKNLDNLS